LKICGIALRGVGAAIPTSRRLRSVYYITIDRLTKELTPTSIFVNACMTWVYKETEKFFAHFAQH